MKIVILLFVVFVAALSVMWSSFADIRLNKNAIAQSFVSEIAKISLTTFRLTLDRHPSTEEGLAALLRAPRGSEGKWKGPYFSDDRVVFDPWGREYQYRCPGLRNPASYDLWSLGPDGLPSADDIGNWSK